MTLAELRKEAEEQVGLDFDAWKPLSTGEREALVFQKMLKILEDDEESIFEQKLKVAHEAWTTRAWALNGAPSFPSFLCDVGGRYKNENGEPSGTAYDLANYTSVVWEALALAGYDPVQVALQGWSKARLLVSTVKQNIKLVGPGNQDEAKAVEIQDVGPIRTAVALVVDPDISVRAMGREVSVPRVPPFGVQVALQSDGSWSIRASVTDQQFTLLQTLLANHVEVHFE